MRTSVCVRRGNCTHVFAGVFLCERCHEFASESQMCMSMWSVFVWGCVHALQSRVCAHERRLARHYMSLPVFVCDIGHLFAAHSCVSAYICTSIGLSVLFESEWVGPRFCVRLWCMPAHERVCPGALPRRGHPWHPNHPRAPQRCRDGSSKKNLCLSTAKYFVAIVYTGLLEYDVFPPMVSSRFVSRKSSSNFSLLARISFQGCWQPQISRSWAASDYEEHPHLILPPNYPERGGPSQPRPTSPLSPRTPLSPQPHPQGPHLDGQDGDQTIVLVFRITPRGGKGRLPPSSQQTRDP